MNDATRLERWYRRMLAWYPAEHRRTYGDEMIGVLLASSPAGRRRPRPADLIDLIRGGLRARRRPAGSGNPDVGWRDALAVFSVVAPAMALGYFVITRAVFLAQWPFYGIADFRRWAGGAATAAFLIFVALGLPPLLALRGLRRTAILVASVPAVILTGYIVWRFATMPTYAYGAVGLDGYWLYSVLAVIALAVSAGPRRGAAIMTARSWSVVGIAAGLAGLAVSLPWYDVLSDHLASEVGGFAMLATIAAAAAGLALTLPAGAGPRVLLLLAIPGYAAVMESGAHGSFPLAFWPLANAVDNHGLEVVYLPTVALAGLVAVLAWRSGHRGPAASQDGGSAAS